MSKLKCNRETLTSLGLSAVGMLAYALSMDLFLVSNNIAAGGVSGLAVVLNKVVPISIGTLIFLMNVPILLFSWWMNGIRYTASAIIGSSMLAFLIDELAVLPSLTSDPLVASVFGGAIYGFGMAMLTRGGGSTGGTDLLNRTLLKKAPTMSIGKMSMILDGTVVVVAMIVFRNIEVGLYAIITLFVCSVTADQILLGYDRGCISLVVTSMNAETVARPLMETIGRGVTNLPGTGMYSGTERNVLMLGIRPNELPKVKRVLQETDPEAFVMLLPANELIGGQFRYDRFGRRP